VKRSESNRHWVLRTDLFSWASSRMAHIYIYIYIYIHVTIRRLRTGSLRKLNFSLPGSIRAKIQMEAARGGRRPGRLHVAQLHVPRSSGTHVYRSIGVRVAQVGRTEKCTAQSGYA
jgi:hypothetical protein